MTMPTPLPFGLREIKLTKYTSDAATALEATSVKLPNARTLSFAEVEEFEELRGDDQLVATHGSGAQVEWELEAGGVDLDAIPIMYGGTTTDSGIDPAMVRTLDKKVTESRPYFKIEGRAISDSGGDFHVIIYRAKATDNLEGELADGTFFLTGASGVGLPSLMTADLDKVWSFIQNQTEMPIT